MSGTDKQKVIYWDSCVYIAWLLEEMQHGADVFNALRQISQENFQRKTVIITSTITFIEVLAVKLGSEKEALFRKSFRRPDHITYDVDPPIAMKARELREQFVNSSTGKKLATPDAIHLATAVTYKADEFLTLDAGLLTINGNAAVDGLKISKPFVDQQNLFGISN